MPRRDARVICAMTIAIAAGGSSTACSPAGPRSVAPITPAMPAAVAAAGRTAARWEVIDPATPAPTLHPDGLVAVAGASDGRVAVVSLASRLRVELVQAGVSTVSDLASITAAGGESLAVTLTADAVIVGIATPTKLRVVRLVRGTATELALAAPPAPTTPTALTSPPTIALDSEGRPVLATRAIAADHEVIEIRRFDGTRWIATRSARFPARYTVVAGIRRESCATIGSRGAPDYCTPIDPPAVVVDAARTLVIAWVSNTQLRTARVEAGRIVERVTIEVPPHAITSPWGATPVLVSRAPEPGWLAAFGDQLLDPRGPMRDALPSELGATRGGAAFAGGVVLVAHDERLGSSLVWWHAPSHRAAPGGRVARAEIAVAGTTIVSLAPTAGGLRAVKLDGADWVPPATAPLATFINPGPVKSLAIVAGASGPAIAWLGGPSVSQPVARIATSAGWTSAGTTLAGIGDPGLSIPILALADDRDGPVAVTGSRDSAGARLVVKRWTGRAWTPIGVPIPTGGPTNPALATVVMADGAPIVAWIESAGIRVARWRGTSWQRSDGPPVQHAYRLAIDASTDLRMVIAMSRGATLTTMAWIEGPRGWRMTTTALTGAVHALAIRGDLVAAALGHPATGELGLATSRGGRWERHGTIESGVLAADVAIADSTVGVAWVRREDVGIALLDGDAVTERVRLPFGSASEGGGEVSLAMSPRPCAVFARPSPGSPPVLTVRCHRR